MFLIYFIRVQIVCDTLNRSVIFIDILEALSFKSLTETNNLRTESEQKVWDLYGRVKDGMPETILQTY